MDIWCNVERTARAGLSKGMRHRIYTYYTGRPTSYHFNLQLTRSHILVPGNINGDTSLVIADGEVNLPSLEFV